MTRYPSLCADPLSPIHYVYSRLSSALTPISNSLAGFLTSAVQAAPTAKTWCCAFYDSNLYELQYA